MTRILAIDPGDTHSGYAFIDVADCRPVAVGKALRHHKLPNQDEIRRIYKEIESKDERLELNLYIVGEAGGEEEGAMAEGSQE